MEMFNLFKAFLFKIRKDLTFRITMFIGLGLAVIMSLIYLGIDNLSGSKELCTGQNMLISSLSPAQNFGIAIPVNLISFTVLEFTQGTIRNKIIAGNSKLKIYVSLFFSGLVFTLVILFAYAGISFGLGSLFGGFDPNGMVLPGLLPGLSSPEYILKTILLTVIVYTTITSITIFFATTFRSIGPCIPVVIIFIMIAYFSSFIITNVNPDAEQIIRYINPLHALVAISNEGGALSYPDDRFITGIIVNVVYIAIFFTGGLVLFRTRDVK